MNTWVALLKREWLEHRGGFLWAPLSVLALLVVVALLITFTVRLMPQILE